MTKTMEFGRNDVENILETLLLRTKEQKQQWKFIKYNPITLEEKIYDKAMCCIFQGIKVETSFRKQTLLLQFSEKIYLPSEKGDITGTLSYNGYYGVQVYEFALSYDWERYLMSKNNTVYKEFSDSVIVRLNDLLMRKYLKSDMINYKDSDIYFPIKNEWNDKPIIALCEKMLKKRMMFEFHNCILDMEYRNRLLGIQ